MPTARPCWRRWPPPQQPWQGRNTLYISGQLGIGATGALEEGVEAQTRQVRLPSTSSTQALANMGHLLQAAGCDHRHVVKTTVLLQDIDHFPLVDAVYGEVFAEAPPARATFQVPWENTIG